MVRMQNPELASSSAPIVNSPQFSVPESPQIFSQSSSSQNSTKNIEDEEPPQKQLNSDFSTTENFNGFNKRFENAEK